MTVQAMTQVRMTSLISVLWFTWGKNKNVLTCGFNQADNQASCSHGAYVQWKVLEIDLGFSCLHMCS